ncbi:O-antigen ligase family protein [Wenxinia saemankumensis]|uniref:Exopolysaccharide production protein ExoQ n=1 Tax=Wenxinia saemankumensis TaxID=1447782 RepID=A0A1M5ZYA3_9RHOB|nr:O-antigen ligase [Wenxinia saemankumensis]SHI29255.1 exopolysaccharide production protein ExoQ [Wenxinia saemankumensis]
MAKDLQEGHAHGYGIAAVAISSFVFAYSIRFGPVSILLFYALWLVPFVLNPQILLVGIRHVAPLLVLPVLAVLSMLWSDAPAQTLRTAVQWATTVGCGLIAARLVPVTSLAAGGCVGGLMVLGYSAWIGDYAYDVVDGTYAFTGAFRSKNQVGFYASLTLLSATAVLVLYRATTAWRAIALAALMLAVISLVASRSATSILSLGVAGAAILLTMGLSVLPGRVRGAALIAIVAGGVVSALAALRLGALDATLAIFDKDTSLTGRTYLWREGVEQGGEHPLLGLGYAAFWLPGQPRAERLWEEFYISGRTGFHFHNGPIEAYVALGLVGLVLFCALLAALLAMVINSAWTPGAAPATSALCAALGMLFIVRATVEVDFFTPYTMGSFLVPFLLLAMADRRSARPRSAPAGRGDAPLWHMAVPARSVRMEAPDRRRPQALQ